MDQLCLDSDMHVWQNGDWRIRECLRGEIHGYSYFFESLEGQESPVPDVKTSIALSIHYCNIECIQMPLTLLSASHYSMRPFTKKHNCQQ